ncbi:META domain-containing protein [Psychrobacter sp. 16-MNA-CIBAN-0192]|uniref:META domain-containing protein n=1 Tax=Psychrobacter sp. 16-MNA-CIBAN-0192 TaxID=3140448 RepID=UPI00332152E3
MKNMTKVMMASVLAVGTLAAGCQTTTTPQTPTIPTQAVTISTLEAFNWQLVDATRSNGQKVSQLFFNPAKPLTLNFMNVNGQHRVAYMNTCNNMGAGYSIVNGNVQIENGISTLMACPEPQASFDTATLATVQGKYSLSKNANNVPMLTITNASQVATFKAVSKQMIQ